MKTQIEQKGTKGTERAWPRALAIRQPWAWLIVNGYKNIENRTWNTRVRGRFLVHASAGLTRAEYESAKEFALSINSKIPVPDFEQLERGGIVGDVELSTTIETTPGIGAFINCQDQTERIDRLAWLHSPWLEDAPGFGFCLRCARVLPFRPGKGALGFFNPAKGRRMTL